MLGLIGCPLLCMIWPLLISSIRLSPHSLGGLVQRTYEHETHFQFDAPAATAQRRPSFPWWLRLLGRCAERQRARGPVLPGNGWVLRNQVTIAELPRQAIAPLHKHRGHHPPLRREPNPSTACAPGVSFPVPTSPDTQPSARPAPGLAGERRHGGGAHALGRRTVGAHVWPLEFYVFHH